VLSIIIPTLNEKENLERLLPLLKEQMEEGDEIIIVDGYSKDGTAEVAIKHGARVIFQKPRGIGLAKTEGAKHAKNDVFLFLDADCVPSKDFLKRVKQHFKDGDVHAVGGLDLYESDSAIWKFMYDTYSRGVFHSAALLHAITGKYWIPANNAAYKKSLFFSVNGFRSVICEDTDMMHRLPPSKNVKYDHNLVLVLSDRRFKEKGFFRTLALWLLSNLSVLLGKGISGKGYRKT